MKASSCLALLLVAGGLLIGTVCPSQAADHLVGGYSEASVTNTEFVYTVGTDTNGVPMQQVAWLYDSPELKRQVCAVFAGTVVDVVKVVDGKAEVKCRKGTPTLPIANKLTRQDTLATDAPQGWMDKNRLVRVRLSALESHGGGRTGDAGETDRTEHGTLTFRDGFLVFTSPSGTNRYPLVDRKTRKTLPLPGLVVVNFSERVLMSREGDEWGVSMLHLRTTEGVQLVLDEDAPVPVTREHRLTTENGVTNKTFIWKQDEVRTATGVLAHFPSNVRSAQAWYGHNFMVGSIPVKPTAAVPESELIKHVGKKVSVSGVWNPGFVWKPTDEERNAQHPVNLDKDAPVVRGDGIIVERMEVSSPSEHRR